EKSHVDKPPIFLSVPEGGEGPATVPLRARKSDALVEVHRLEMNLVPRVRVLHVLSEHLADSLLGLPGPEDFGLRREPEPPVFPVPPESGSALALLLGVQVENVG